MASTKILHGDCLDILRRATSNSVDSIVTDPPYGLSFMGKKWDYDVPSKEIWQECLRVLKPGGYLLSFAGTRTQHRMAVNIEDAGFEIRDMIAWIYGSGFPKSLNIGKAVAKAMGEDVKIGTAFKAAGEYGNRNLQDPTPINDREQFRHIPQTEEAKQWEGWGTALKPALEPITVARKPLSEKTVAENVLKWGTGGINIDGSRVETTDNLNGGGYNTSGTSQKDLTDASSYATKVMEKEFVQPDGRFPANLIHDGSDEVVSLFPETKSGGGDKRGLNNGSIWGHVDNREKPTNHTANSGSAARFFKQCEFMDTDFHEPDCLSLDEVQNIMGCTCNYGKRFLYQPKASKADRDEGLEGFEAVQTGSFDGNADTVNTNRKIGEHPDKPNAPRKNNHPTVKPTKLMQYLVKLVTPKGGVILDPFMGSGSTGKACKLEGFDFIGIEMDADYIEIAKARINAIKNETTTVPS